MSDDRLFASNNAIGRKWYFLNLIILAFIATGTHILFTDHIIPNVVSDTYEIIATGFLYLAYIVYLVTFLALIERRLYDITGTRDSNVYRNISSILTLAVFSVGLEVFCRLNNPSLPFPQEIITKSAMILGSIFIFCVFCFLFPRGNISNLSYEEYRKKIKYE